MVGSTCFSNFTLKCLPDKKRMTPKFVLNGVVICKALDIGGNFMGPTDCVNR